MFTATGQLKAFCFCALAFVGTMDISRSDETAPKANPQITSSKSVESDGVSCLASFASPQYSGGDRIVLNLTVMNKRKEALRLRSDKPLGDLALSIIGPDHKDVPLTSFGKEYFANQGTAVPLNSGIRGLEGGSRYVVNLKTDEKTAVAFDLSRLFDLSGSGNYRVLVTWTLPSSVGGAGKSTFKLEGIPLYVEERQPLGFFSESDIVPSVVK